MDLQAAILAEHSKENTLKIVAYIGNSKERFAQLMKLFLGKDYRTTQRAAWPLGIIGQQQPGLIQPYLSTLVTLLNNNNSQPSAVQRNITRILQTVPLPEAIHGKLMDACFKLVESIETPIAIKAFSLTILGRLAKEYPEIKNEIKLLIEANLEHASAGVKSRAEKVLRELNK
jgi:hypothetical protein